MNRTNTWTSKLWLQVSDDCHLYGWTELHDAVHSYGSLCDLQRSQHVCNSIFCKLRKPLNICFFFPLPFSLWVVHCFLDHISRQKFRCFWKNICWLISKYVLGMVLKDIWSKMAKSSKSKLFRHNAYINAHKKCMKDHN